MTCCQKITHLTILSESKEKNLLIAFHLVIQVNLKMVFYWLWYDCSVLLALLTIQTVYLG